MLKFRELPKTGGAEVSGVVENSAGGLGQTSGSGWTTRGAEASRFWSPLFVAVPPPAPRVPGGLSPFCRREAR